MRVLQMRVLQMRVLQMRVLQMRVLQTRVLQMRERERNIQQLLMWKANTDELYRDGTIDVG